MLSLRVGEDWYPGDAVPSANWPPWRQERRASSTPSAACTSTPAASLTSPKPPVLWVRGADDMIVSNNAFWDIAALGAMGFVPGWPGADACPPQPMVDQTRAVLERYQANGGTYREEVIADAGHSPFMEKPEEFNRLFHAFIGE